MGVGAGLMVGVGFGAAAWEVRMTRVLTDAGHADQVLVDYCHGLC